MGFTLVELMIVVTIIGILASILIPKFSDMIRKAREGTLKGNLGMIRGALNIYYADMEGLYPTSPIIGGIPASNGDLLILTANGKYLSSVPDVTVPDYHVPIGSVLPGIGPDMSGEAPTVPQYFIANPDLSPFGFWVYFPDPTYAATWGQVVVGCQHTDTKGTVWSSY
jgi:prepilin-type N-terminal cleavage/methylation domain-containing protein